MTQGQALFYKLDDGVEASFIVDDEILVRSSDKTVLGVIRESGNVVAVIRVKDSRVGVDVEAYLGNEFSIQESQAVARLACDNTVAMEIHIVIVSFERLKALTGLSWREIRVPCRANVGDYRGRC